MKKLTIIAIASALALAHLTLSHAKTDLLEKSFSVSNGGTVYLDTDSGSVEVESHDRDTVTVVVLRKGKSIENLEVELSQDGNDIKVKGDKKGSSFMSFGKSGTHFVIKVPQQYNVDLKTSGGSIELASLNGKVEAYTSGGSIKLGKIKGDVEVKTSGGSIKVDQVEGNIEAHTSGGSITAKLLTQPTEDSRLTTSGGSITAYLAPSIAVNLEAKTSGGSVSSEFDVKGSVKRTKIEGSINGGGPELYLKTSGGSVRIKKL